MTQFTPDIGAGRPRLRARVEIRQCEGPHQRPGALPMQVGAPFSPPSFQRVPFDIPNRCPCALREDTAIPHLELATPFKQQRRSCRTDVGSIIKPQKVDNETKRSGSGICPQTRAQPSPDSPTSGHSHVFTHTHRRFSGNFQTK